MASGVGTALKCRCAAIDNAAIDQLPTSASEAFAVVAIFAGVTALRA